LLKHYNALAELFGVNFTDDGDMLATDGIHSIYFCEVNNEALAHALTLKIRYVFLGKPMMKHVSRCEK